MENMAGFGIMILRVTVGITMVAHGLPKIFWKREVFNKKWKEEYGFPKPSVIVTGIAQVLCGAAIFLGILTQGCSLLLALNMVVATYVSIHFHGEPFLSTPEGKGWDVNLLLIVAMISLVLLGGGALALVG